MDFDELNQKESQYKSNIISVNEQTAEQLQINSQILFANQQFKSSIKKKNRENFEMERKIEIYNKYFFQD